MPSASAANLSASGRTDGSDGFPVGLLCGYAIREAAGSAAAPAARFRKALRGSFMVFPPHLTATDFTQLIIGRGFVTAFGDQSVTPKSSWPPPGIISRRIRLITERYR